MLSRGKFLAFLSEVPPCQIVMEACGGAHHWGRQIIALGHTCKLIPPIYVKPFLKRQKNDTNDAAAIVEAAQRPTMRFVAVKSEEAQADAMLFRTRALLVRQRTQTINSLRGQLAEFGVIAAQGVGSIAMLRFEWGTAKATLPEQVVPMTELLFEQIAALSQKIAGLEKEIRSRTRAREEMQRLMTIPGIGSICAMAVNAFAPPMESFGCGRDFAAWVGLTPRQHSTAGKQRLGRITKMGAARPPPVARPGGNVSSLAYAQARGSGRPLAPEDADGGKAAEAGRSRTGEQDGAHHLGAVGQEGNLPGTSSGLPLVRNSYPEEKGCLALERRALRTRS